MAINPVVMLIDYEKFKYAVYFIPTFAGNIFNLNNFSIIGMLSQTADTSRGLIFAEAMLSYLFFGAVNTGIGLLVFGKRDVK
jgi:ABC-type antimicrobial peptide transport system permease subunit